MGSGKFPCFVLADSCWQIRVGRLQCCVLGCAAQMDKESVQTRRRIEPLMGGVALLLLLVGCVVVLRPFLSALMWAMVLAFSLYPLQRRFTSWFRGSRTLAACLVTLTLTVLLAGPVVWIGVSLAEDGKALAAATRKWFLSMPDEAPALVSRTPVFGKELADYWVEFAVSRKQWMEKLEQASQDPPPRAKIVVEKGNELVVDDAPEPPPVPAQSSNGGSKPESPELIILLGRLIAWARTWLISVGLAVGNGVVQVLVSAFLTFFMLRDGQVLSERMGVAVDHLTGGRGRHLMNVAGATVKGVIFGILGTALAQAVVAGIGFGIAGVPGAVLLGGLTFFFAVIPFGPPVIWIPATLWLFSQGSPGWGMFMLLWGVLGISGVDNFLRPYLISHGSKMPFVLIFCGVIGGAMAFGLVGVFLGPTLLAVTFRLIEEWAVVPTTAVKVVANVDALAERDFQAMVIGDQVSDNTIREHKEQLMPPSQGE
jgi:predicted PurR-regulated permease PerM